MDSFIPQQIRELPGCRTTCRIFGFRSLFQKMEANWRQWIFMMRSFIIRQIQGFHGHRMQFPIQTILRVLGSRERFVVPLTERCWLWELWGVPFSPRPILESIGRQLMYPSQIGLPWHLRPMESNWRLRVAAVVFIPQSIQEAVGHFRPMHRMKTGIPLLHRLMEANWWRWPEGLSE